MNALLPFDPATGCLSLEGELTIYEANTIAERLRQAFQTGSLETVDLAGITEIDTAGLQILLMAKSLRVSGEKSVELAKPSDAVRHLLDLVGLEHTQ